MHELYDDLTEICDTLSEELSKANSKLDSAGGEMTAGDLEYIDKLTHALKSVKTIKAMMDSEDGMSRDDGMMMNRGTSSNGYSYRRGRGYNARRDSMGRYSSERGYSRDDNMIMELRELMEDVPDERTRKEFQKFINKVQSM